MAKQRVAQERGLGKQLVARERELAQLVSAVTGGRGAVLSGPAGVGKTALAAAVARYVESSGERVERLVATEASRSIWFGALAPVLPADIIPLHPALVLAAIRRRQDELGASAAPTLFVVDDAHLLDDHSAATLLGLVSTGAVRVIATVRAGDPTPDAVRALWKDGFVDHHEIAPFDRRATHEFLAAILGGEVAGGTASLLWQHTQGNALYLSELARDARANHRLVDEHGVWIWRGDLTVPPRLADLLDRRFDGLSPAGLDALGALVLGEPLPIAALEDVATMAGVAELEARQVVVTSERDGITWYRFVHPMLGAAAAHLLTPTRRRRLADALIAAPPGGTDIVRRAMWQLDASGPPDVDVLCEGAAAVFLTQPELARRLAERALPHDPTPLSALLLADAHAELGQVDAARQAQSVALGRVQSDDDRLRVHLNQVSLTAFSDRRPDLALESLTIARSELPERLAPEIDSMAAQVTAFSARPADALDLAERVLDGAPPRASMLRASSARVLALAMIDRSVEALAAADRLLADLASGPASPYAQGIAHIAAQIARFTYWAGQHAPATDPSGRWPVPPAHRDRPLPADSLFHPLFEGGRRLLEGQVAAAIPPLREAVAQQRSGEGLLQSEAVALLVVALAAGGSIDEARGLLAESPPDRVAVYAGLRPWAESAVEAAEGSPSAVSLAFAAYEEARSAGSPISAVAYLAAAARYGAATPAAAELTRWEHRFESPISAVRAGGVAARASGDATALLDAAEQHAALGLAGDATELADLALAAMGNVRSAAQSRARARALADDLRRRLRQADTALGDLLVPLTRRELEVATLAARGMSDQDIAATLVISVRTVESHLAATYRKLGIKSRRGLRPALSRGGEG